MARKKTINLFVVDGDTKFVNTLEEYCLDHFNENINLFKKKTTKNGFNSRQADWLKSDVFIFFASLADGSAIEMVEVLKGNDSTRDKKIIFLVDKQTMNYVTLAKQNDVDAILMKPFKLTELIQTINNLRES